jgi:O-antigen/teichoic acid export membrane protein
MMSRLQNELRDDGRLARVFKGGISGVLSKASTLVATALSLPIAVRYLGPQQYGFWVTISTNVVMFAVMDLGIAFTLTNHIATAYARNDRTGEPRYYATAFWTSTAIAVLVAVGAILLWPVVSWGRLFHVSDDLLAHEVSRCAAVALAFFLLSLPLNLVHRVLGGYQQTEITNYFNVFRNLLSLAAILVVASLHGSLFR